MTTRSEALFDEYCALRDYRSEPVEAGSDAGKTPDRLVATPAGEIVVEIKELTASPEDVRCARELKERRWTTRGGTPGARTSRIIKRAADQLRALDDGTRPAVLVLFDNIVVDGVRPSGRCIHLEASFIDFGMYGLQSVFVTRESTAAGPRLVCVGEGRAGRRQMTEDSRTYVSALAVLQKEPKSARPFLVVYHNYFARNPLPFEVFRGPHDRHLRKRSHPNESPQHWVEEQSDGAA